MARAAWTPSKRVSTPVTPGPLQRLQFHSTWLRPLWHGAILIWIVVHPLPLWQNGVTAVATVVLVATNMLVRMQVDDPNWVYVIRGTLRCELWLSLCMSLFFAALLPEGPAPLLMLPALAALLSRSEPHQSLDTPTDSESSLSFSSRLSQLGVSWREVGLAICGLCISLWVDFSPKLTMAVPGFHHQRSPANVETVSALLFGLYVVLCCALLGVSILLRQQTTSQRETQRMFAELQAQSAQLAQTNERLNEFADKVYHLAAAEERNRIAGEIHDTVAHRLTALFVQLQAARRQLDTGELNAALDNLDVSEALTRESLDAVRSSVRAIRHVATDGGHSALRRLATQYASLTGMAVELEMSAEVEWIPPTVFAVLYRVLQEGLTNAKRHGRASEVQLRVRRRAGELVLQVRDNGRGCARPRYGFGLGTMRERIQTIGGTLQLTSSPGRGFLLEVRVPLWEGVSS